MPHRPFQLANFAITRMIASPRRYDRSDPGAIARVRQLAVAIAPGGGTLWRGASARAQWPAWTLTVRVEPVAAQLAGNHDSLRRGFDNRER